MRSIVTERFPAAMNAKCALTESPDGGRTLGATRRADDPVGASMSTTSAPKSANIRPVYAAASDDTSTTRTP